MVAVAGAAFHSESILPARGVAERRPLWILARLAETLRDIEENHDKPDSAITPRRKRAKSYKVMR
jgi:hypothetical protein